MCIYTHSYFELLDKLMFSKYALGMSCTAFHSLKAEFFHLAKASFVIIP